MRKVILFLGLFLLVGQVGFGQELNLDEERKRLINQLKADVEQAVNNTQLAIKALIEINALKLDATTKAYTKNAIINSVQDYYAKNATVEINRIDKKRKLSTKIIRLERYLKEPKNIKNIKKVDFVIFLGSNELLEDEDDIDKYYYEYKMIRSLNILKDKENHIDATTKNGKAIFNQNQKNYIMFSEKGGLKFKIVGITCIEE